MTPRVRFIRPELPPWEVVRGKLEEVYRAGRFHPAEHVADFERAVQEKLGVKHAVMVSTASDGLILLAHLAHSRTLNESGGEIIGRIIVPSWTFRATVQVCEWAAAPPLVVDVREDGNLDPEKLADAVAKYDGREHEGVSAVIGVHVFGKPCDVEAIEAALDGREVALFYDAAHALGATVGDRYVGRFGDAEVFSLNITKSVPSCGEGGIITTDDGELAEVLRMARWHGDVPGSLDWKVAGGMNAKPTEWQAIVAHAALDRMDGVTIEREGIAEVYEQEFAALEGVRPMHKVVEMGVESAWKDYAIRCADAGVRARVEAALTSSGVEYKRYFHPAVSDLDYIRRAVDALGEHEVVHSCEVGRRLAETVLCLPIYSTLEPAEQEIVIEAVRAGARG